MVRLNLDQIKTAVTNQYLLINNSVGAATNIPNVARRASLDVTNKAPAESGVKRGEKRASVSGGVQPLQQVPKKSKNEKSCVSCGKNFTKKQLEGKTKHKCMVGVSALD